MSTYHEETQSHPVHPASSSFCRDLRPLLFTMGILPFFSSCKRQDKPQDNQTPLAIAIDLKEFKTSARHMA
jgi:hypothetical protein